MLKRSQLNSVSPMKSSSLLTNLHMSSVLVLIGPFPSLYLPDSVFHAQGLFIHHSRLQSFRDRLAALTETGSHLRSTMSCLMHLQKQLKCHLFTESFGLWILVLRYLGFFEGHYKRSIALPLYFKKYIFLSKDICKYQLVITHYYTGATHSKCGQSLT